MNIKEMSLNELIAYRVAVKIDLENAKGKAIPDTLKHLEKVNQQIGILRKQLKNKTIF